MDEAARELSQAREQQVSEWKQELTTELDRSIQEMIQLAREQENLEQQARKGASPEQLRAQQGSLQQGVEMARERCHDWGYPGAQRKSEDRQCVDGVAASCAKWRVVREYRCTSEGR